MVHGLPEAFNPNFGATATKKGSFPQTYLTCLIITHFRCSISETTYLCRRTAAHSRATSKEGVIALLPRSIKRLDRVVLFGTMVIAFEASGGTFQASDTRVVCLACAVQVINTCDQGKRHQLINEINALYNANHPW